MSGLAGFVDAGAFRKPDPRDLERMLGALSSRGPGGQETWLRRYVGLGLRGDGEPATGASSRSALVLDGRLSNGRRLRRELESRGRRFSDGSDTETALALYESEGEKGLARLQGAFALALWDDGHKKLICLRDQLGQKPLHYVFQGGAFYFASNLEALLSLKTLGWRLDSPKIPLLLSMGYLPGTGTLYKGLRRLAPGHALTLHRGRLQLRRLGTAGQSSPDRRPAEVRVDSEEPAFFVKDVRGSLRRSVAEGMEASPSPGLMLSGDLNSGILAALAAQDRAKIPTFSISFKDEKGREPGAREAFKLSKALGTDHAELAMSPRGFAEVFFSWVKNLEGGLGDTQAVPEFFLSLFARRKVKAVLGPQGADELFGGGLLHAASGQSQEGLPAWKRAWLGFLATLRKDQPGKNLLDAAEAAALNPGLGRYLGFARRVSADRLLRILGENVERTWEEAKLEQSFSGYFTGEDFLESTLRADLDTYIPSALLPRLDAMSSAAGLELRLPYMDPRLAAQALRIPAAFKVRAGLGKWILREAAKGLLPAWVIKDRRPPSQVPVSDWLRGPLREVLVQTLTAKACRERGLFNPKGVDGMLANHLSGRSDEGPCLWSLLVLEAWLAQV